MSKVRRLESELLKNNGIKHGWFMRHGGVSEGLFKSLNGKKGNGDSDESVDNNRNRALKELHTDSNKLAHIVHEFKTNILLAAEEGEFEYFDAALTDKEDIVLSQATADCASVIIADTKGSCVALVHGSWHTLKAKIICDVVAKLKTEFGATELVAGIGPMICMNCYEFGPEAKGLFDARYLQPKSGKYLVDLKQMAIDQLQESGVSEIDDNNICTLEDERYFSHRRSGAHSGRMITLACLS